MFSVKLKMKLLLLLVLSMVTLGAHFGGGTTTAESCGKCTNLYDENDNPVGFACIRMGLHRCIATARGCDFPLGACNTNENGGGPIGPYTPPGGN